MSNDELTDLIRSRLVAEHRRVLEQFRDEAGIIPASTAAACEFAAKAIVIFMAVVHQKKPEIDVNREIDSLLNVIRQTIDEERAGPAA